MNDPTVIFAVLILSSNWFCCSPMRNSVFWVATKILVVFFHPQLDCLICVPQRYSSGVSLRFRQNLYTEFRTSHLWLSPFLDSPSLHLPSNCDFPDLRPLTFQAWRNDSTWKNGICCMCRPTVNFCSELAQLSSPSRALKVTLKNLSRDVIIIYRRSGSVRDH